MVLETASVEWGWGWGTCDPQRDKTIFVAHGKDGAPSHTAQDTAPELISRIARESRAMASYYSLLVNRIGSSYLNLRGHARLSHPRTFPTPRFVSRSTHRMPLSTLTLNDGTQTPWIAFGTGTALYKKDAADAVTVAIQNGFTHLDGAQVYGNETTLGEGIVASGVPRSELYITTKLAALGPGETPKSALEESLKKLGVAYVDLYLIHQANQHVGKLKQVWKGMEEAKKAGLTKSIGVSNFTADHLNDILEVATIPPAVNQVGIPLGDAVQFITDIGTG